MPLAQVCSTMKKHLPSNMSRGLGSNQPESSVRHSTGHYVHTGKSNGFSTSSHMVVYMVLHRGCNIKNNAGHSYVYMCTHVITMVTELCSTLLTEGTQGGSPKMTSAHVLRGSGGRTRILSRGSKSDNAASLR